MLLILTDADMADVSAPASSLQRGNTKKKKCYVRSVLRTVSDALRRRPMSGTAGIRTGVRSFTLGHGDTAGLLPRKGKTAIDNTTSTSDALRHLYTCTGFNGRSEELRTHKTIVKCTTNATFVDFVS